MLPTIPFRDGELGIKAKMKWTRKSTCNSSLSVFFNHSIMVDPTQSDSCNQKEMRSDQFSTNNTCPRLVLAPAFSSWKLYKQFRAPCTHHGEAFTFYEQKELKWHGLLAWRCWNHCQHLGCHYISVEKTELKRKGIFNSSVLTMQTITKVHTKAQPDIQGHHEGVFVLHSMPAHSIFNDTFQETKDLKPLQLDSELLFSSDDSNSQCCQCWLK